MKSNNANIGRRLVMIIWGEVQINLNGIRIKWLHMLQTISSRLLQLRPFINGRGQCQALFVILGRCLRLTTPMLAHVFQRNGGTYYHLYGNLLTWVVRGQMTLCSW